MQHPTAAEEHPNVTVVPTGAHQDAVANGRSPDLNPIALALRLHQRSYVATVEPPRLHFRHIGGYKDAKDVTVIEVENAPTVRPVVASAVRDVWNPDELLHQNSPGKEPGVNCPAGCGSLIRASATNVAETV